MQCFTHRGSQSPIREHVLHDAVIPHVLEAPFRVGVRKRLPHDLAAAARIIGRVVGKSDKQPKPKHRADGESTPSDEVSLGYLATAAALLPPPDLRGIRGCARLNASHGEAVLDEMRQQQPQVFCWQAKSETRNILVGRTNTGKKGHSNRVPQAKAGAQNSRSTAAPAGRRHDDGAPYLTQRETDAAAAAARRVGRGGGGESFARTGPIIRSLPPLLFLICSLSLPLGSLKHHCCTPGSLSLNVVVDATSLCCCRKPKTRDAQLAACMRRAHSPRITTSKRKCCRCCCPGYPPREHSPEPNRGRACRPVEDCRLRSPSAGVIAGGRGRGDEKGERVSFARARQANCERSLK